MVERGNGKELRSFLPDAVQVDTQQTRNPRKMCIVECEMQHIG
jgi:hypothetical protein